MSRYATWPEGATKLVSFEARKAIARTKDFHLLTPEERLAAAMYYDATRGEPPIPTPEKE